MRDAVDHVWMGIEMHNSGMGVLTMQYVNSVTNKWFINRNATENWRMFFFWQFFFTLKLYTDGIVFRVRVFCILKISKLFKPFDGKASIDVPERSLEWKSNKL